MFTGSAFGLISGVMLVGLLTSACVVDVRSRRIPNRLVAVLALSGMAFSMLHFGAAPGVWRASSGLAVGLAIWLPFHVVRLLGAGDVKLFAAASTWLGVDGALEAALLSALAGGVLACVWLFRAYGVSGTVRALGGAVVTPAALLERPQDPPMQTTRLPYGLALATGVTVVAWWPGLLFGS